MFSGSFGSITAMTMTPASGMKAVMYHYVREAEPDLPHFRYLHARDFERQLRHFAERYGFVERDAFFASVETGRPAPGIVLTFDDGVADHHDIVLPILERLGLWGLFFIPTAMYETGKLLDVHRIHLLLGRHGGIAMLQALDEILTPAMLSHEHVEEFRALTYARQDNDAATTRFKRVLNYFIAYEHREAVLDRLMQRFCPDEAALTQRFYVTPEGLCRMRDGGMVIGSHGVNHRVFSKLDPAEQALEIGRSFDFLEATLDQPVTTFCYPYGGFHTFTAETERLLAERGCRAAFNVEPRDVADRDLRQRPQALPRYDCNQFPHGRASYGPARAA
jgi:peptidoglycan/xylan/chitin deacetylase (PgdA/CDA1 family)